MHHTTTTTTASSSSSTHGQQDRWTSRQTSALPQLQQSMDGYERKKGAYRLNNKGLWDSLAFFLGIYGIYLGFMGWN